MMTSRLAKRVSVVWRRDEPGRSALLLAGVVLLSSWIGSSTAVSLAPVYWNSTNPMFKISKNDHIIDVKPFDDIDFVCPFYSTTHGGGGGGRRGAVADAESQHEEQYLIYRVSKSEYDDCNIYNPEYSEGGSGLAGTALLILNCSTPRLRRRFTILFEPFQSIPNVPEYKAGRSYYFITTSSGKRHGLNNLVQGACYYNNMKLTVRVSNGGNSVADDPSDNTPDDSNYGDESAIATVQSSLSSSHTNSVVSSQSNGRLGHPAVRSSPSTTTTTRRLPAARSDVPTPLPVTSQPVHRTAHRRKHTTSSTPVAVPSSATRDVVAIRHPQRHHDKQRHREISETVSQPVSATLPLSALKLEQLPAQRRDSLPTTKTTTSTSASLRYSTLITVLATSVCYTLITSFR